MSTNNTSTIYGTDLVLLIETAANSWQQVAHATGHTLQITRDTREVSSKSTGEWLNKDYAKISWSGSVDGLTTFDSAIIGAAEFIGYMIARTKIKIISVLNDADNDTPLDDLKSDYDPSSTTGADNPFETATTYWEGEAVITDVSQTANEGETATFSMSFEGASALTPKTVATTV